MLKIKESCTDMTCVGCIWHETLYSTINGEMMPTNLWRCRSHLQKAKYSKRAMAVGHPASKNCRFNSGLVDADQMKLEVY